MKDFIRKILNYFEIIKISLRNTYKNMKYINNFSKKRQNNMEYNMLLLVHSLEKGMSLKNIKYGYGKQKIESLIQLINEYRKKFFYENNYAYEESISILKSYLNLHKNVGFNIGHLEKDIKECLAGCNIRNVAGIKSLKKDELINLEWDFESFVKTRHSIRNFSDKDVDKSIIDKAIEIAQFVPSACNRQSSKVYYSEDKDINNEIDKLVPGNVGFDNNVNKYLIITCDIEAFGKLEINQWYVNGGIYTSFLLLALHSLGIGTCVFQWPEIKKKDRELREISKIPNNEQIIVLIGVGEYPEEVNTLLATRKNINDVRKIIK